MLQNTSRLHASSSIILHNVQNENTVKHTQILLDYVESPSYVNDDSITLLYISNKLIVSKHVAERECL